MGLMVHSLEVLSKEATRDYFIYILDYGWDEPIVNVLQRNFQNLARWSSQNESAVINGVGEVGHFDNEVLSWHQINGEDASELLPAILITRTNPHIFREYMVNPDKKKEHDLRYILIPIKKLCKTESDVMNLVTKITNDIEMKKDFKDFRICKELKPGIGKAFIKSIRLEPNIHGIGFSFNKFAEYLK